MDAEANQNWGEIKGYAIAAKTGTANEPSGDPEHPCPKSNPQCVYGASYIGYNTNAGQQVVVAINVQNPDTKTDYFGDEVAGPVFYSVMNAALPGAADPAAAGTQGTVCSAQRGLILDTLWA